MLTDLKALHEELRLAIAELQAEIAKSEPDETNLPLARLKVVKVSGRRKALIDGTIAPGLQEIGADDAARMRDLRRTGSEVAVETSQHIAEWRMTSVLADWQGYRAASTKFSQMMLRRIADECAVLYPLLEARPATVLIDRAA